MSLLSYLTILIDSLTTREQGWLSTSRECLRVLCPGLRRAAAQKESNLPEVETIERDENLNKKAYYTVKQIITSQATYG